MFSHQSSLEGRGQVVDTGLHHVDVLGADAASLVGGGGDGVAEGQRLAETADESVAKFGISITVFGYVGVTVETAATFTKSVACLRANSRLDTTRAAPPSLVAQMSSRCSGSATTGDSARPRRDLLRKRA